jgi:hypothetical protein
MSAQLPAVDDTTTTDIATSNNFADLAASVDTKCPDGVTFGNDGNVGTKREACVPFGNDIGFIRVRKRKLKGGHPDWYRAHRATASMSFDLVRAVRIDGKPRHKFILGLGSQKSDATGRMAAHLLVIAVGRMKAHGLDESQRRALLSELIRKGARRPTIADCEGWRVNDGWTPYVDEVIAWLSADADAEVQS